MTFFPRHTENPHDGPPTANGSRAVKLNSRRQLPLLGSNQDSPDPESGRATGYTLSATTGRVVSRRILSFAPTISPTIFRPLRALSVGRRGWVALEVGG